MFGMFKKKEVEPEKEPQYIVANMNARIQPMHRGEIFEDPLDEELSQNNIGEVSGGGTLQSKSGEIESCDIEILVHDSSDDVINLIKDKLEKLGTPKGSKIVVESTGIEIPFGHLEGLAIYLNGTDLDDSVYQDCDSNFVHSELDRLTKGKGKVFSYWQGATETAIYLYGDSFIEMKSLILELTDNYPLCQKCRIEQVA